MNKLLKIKKSMAIVLTLVIMLSLVAPAMAQEDSVARGINVPATSSKALGPTDPAELEAFLDDLFAKDMEANHIAGAAVAVVKDGELFFAKGYGYADLENRIPVDPERTGFRIGSVTKLFTWTAVMQLVEQGKLDLDADINTYLDFRIPEPYPQPVTLKHLMTHTSGFEDRWVGSLVSDTSELAPEREWLVSNSPGRVRPPGDADAFRSGPAAATGSMAPLEFLGPVPASRVAAARDAAAQVRAQPCEVLFDAVEYWRRPEVLCLLARALPPALDDLVRQLRSALAGRGFEPETRPFRAHLTLARKVPRPVALPAFEPLRWPVSEFALVESVTDRAGSRYTPLASWSLVARGACLAGLTP